MVNIIKVIADAQPKPNLEKLAHEAIDKCKRKFGQDKLWSGNCGQFAWALGVYLGEDNCDLTFVCQNETDEEELYFGEPRVYHDVALGCAGKLWDAQGICHNGYLEDFAEEEYQDEEPSILNGIAMDKRGFTAMNANTDWDIAWQDFYKVMKG